MAFNNSYLLSLPPFTRLHADATFNSLQTSYPGSNIAYNNPQPVQNEIQSILHLNESPLFYVPANNTTHIIPADEFFEGNPLLSTDLKEETKSRYGSALESFRSSTISRQEASLTMDQRLSIYIQERFVANPRAGHKQEMSNLLAMIQLMYPELKYKLGRSRRCISSWNRTKPPKSAAPLNQELCYALVMNLIERNKTESAAVLMLSFEALLRISESLSLKWENILFPGDIRLHGYGASTAGVTILDSKTSRSAGRFQFVKLSDANVIQFLKTYRLTRQEHTSFVENLTYEKYERDIKEASTCFGLDHLNITSHSARIGKATQEYIRGKPVEQLAIDGRWKSLSSLRYYINNGRASLANLQISPANQMALTNQSQKLQRIIATSVE